MFLLLVHCWFKYISRQSKAYVALQIYMDKWFALFFYGFVLPHFPIMCGLSVGAVLIFLEFFLVVSGYFQDSVTFYP